MNCNGLGIVFRLICLALVLLASFATQAFAQIYHVKEMNTEQIRALDRQKTVVLLPGGILEQHGPYLPSFTDGYKSERLVHELANAVVERPGWKVLIFPIIPLGTAPANIIGFRYHFDGSYTVRPSTLRTLYMDLATELGEGGFRWIFVISFHAPPPHHRALNQAGDYFRDTYGGHMVNLPALEGRAEQLEQRRTMMSEKEQQEDASSPHAGMAETSETLFLRPDLVNPAYKKATPLSAPDRKRLAEIAQAEDWPGYFGSPRLASVAYGAQTLKLRFSQLIGLALKILDGFDYRQMPRRGDEQVPPPPAPSVGVKTFRQHNDEIEKKQQGWLKKKGLE